MRRDWFKIDVRTVELDREGFLYITSVVTEAATPYMEVNIRITKATSALVLLKDDLERQYFE